MKRHITCITILTGLYLSSLTLSAQEISLAEAIEAEEVISVSANTYFGVEELNPENIWYAQTEDTRDGVDALHLVTRTGGIFEASLVLKMRGPVEISFWSTYEGPWGNKHDFYYQVWDMEREDPPGVMYGIRPLYSGWNISNSNWTQTTILVREHTEFNLVISLENRGEEPLEAWIDQFSFNRDLPLEISSAPEIFRVPLNMKGVLKVDATGAFPTTYNWFKDQVLITSEEDPYLELLSESTSQSTYQLEVTDKTGSILSDPIEVEVFSLNDALDNQDLVFTISENSSKDYSDLLSKGADAPDGKDALFLDARTTLHDPITLKTVSGIQTEIEGPAVLRFVGSSIISLAVSGDDPKTLYDMKNDQWAHYTLAIPGEGIHTVTWGPKYHSLVYHAAILDQVEVIPMELDNFKIWALQYYSIEYIQEHPETLQQMDGDSDGLDNLLEWLLNKDPFLWDNTYNSEVIGTEDKQYAAIRYSRPADITPYSIHLEASSDMQLWERTESIVEETYNKTNDTYTILVRDIQSLDTGPRFIRLVVSDE